MSNSFTTEVLYIYLYTTVYIFLQATLQKKKYIILSLHIIKFIHFFFFKKKQNFKNQKNLKHSLEIFKRNIY